MDSDDTNPFADSTFRPATASSVFVVFFFFLIHIFFIELLLVQTNRKMITIHLILQRHLLRYDEFRFLNFISVD